MSDANNLVGPSDLSESPSFNGYSSGHHLADIAARVIRELQDDDDDNPCFYSSPYPRSDVFHRHHLEKYKRIQEDEHEDEEERGIESSDQNSNLVEKEGNKNLYGGVAEEGDDDEEEGDVGTESEFEFAVPGAEEGSSPISADEIFHNGQIRPLFPLFNTDLVVADYDWRFDRQEDSHLGARPPPAPNSMYSAAEDTPIRLSLKKLLIEEREAASCSSSEADDLEGVAPDTYCLWTPNHRHEEMSKKSKSTGSVSKRWRLRHLVHRSHSDGGRESFVFVTAQRRDQKQSRPSTSVASESQPHAQKKANEKLPPAPASSEGKGKGKEGAMGNCNVEKRAITGRDRSKKSYLPYKQDLVGLFANVNGVSRTIQPF